ncbi:hypothetical protein [Clostridium sp. D33t1_170424_F3]|uniref:hypothetical protein n=1 Tax=Clostridium sp. D33t1_170424_F3 TaxID=2787099 RepID=UPI0018A9CE93|nr:hypothetical protein [Clostridium sp. D33t1_170424_F3]
MLGKLIKHEFKATARIYLPFFIMLFLFTVVNRVFMQMNSGLEYSPQRMVPQTILMLLYVLAVVIVLVLTLGVTVQRFYKNLMTDEGYLMFTLPVTQDQLILSKLIVAFIWNIFSTAIAMLSFLGLFMDGGTLQIFMKAVGKLWQTAAENQVNLTWLVILAGITFVFGLISGIMQLYASIVIGCTSSRHKILLGLGVYLGFNVVSQIVGSLALPFTSDWLVTISGQKGGPTPVQYAEFFQGMLLFGIVISIVFSVAFYIVTRMMLKRKLNLE